MEFKERIKNIDPFTPYKTMFLTKEEQAQLKNYLKDQVVFDGGHVNAERARAFVASEPHSITCFKIGYNPNFLTLTHQNILGSLLSFNLKRDVIGDILVEESCFYTTTEIVPVILQEFNAIGNHPITLEMIDGSLFETKIELDEFIAYVDSLRLDLIVSKIANIGRTEANEMIDNDLIKVNHLITNKATKTLKQNDILSIRKYGRFELLDTTKTSKKGKIVLKYGKYI